VVDVAVVEPWWLPRVSDGEDGMLKMQRGERHIWPRFSVERGQNMELLLRLRPEAKN